MAAESDVPPVAVKREKTNEWHGEKVVDPFFWLREKENPEVTAYLQKENEYFDRETEQLAPLRKKLYDQCRARIKETDQSAPFKFGDYRYYHRTIEGLQYGVHCRAPLDSGVEEVIWDENEKAKPHKYYHVDSFEISPSGKLLALTEDTRGFREFMFKLVDLRSKQEIATDLGKVTSVEWGASDEIIFFGLEDEAKRSYQVYSYNLQTKDRTLLYHEKDSEFRTYAHVSLDRQYLYVISSASDCTEVRVSHLASREPLRLLIPRQAGRRVSVAEHNGFFYAVTNENAPEFRVVRFPVEKSYAEATEVFPAHPDITYEELRFFKNFAALKTINRGIEEFSFFQPPEFKLTKIAFPEPVFSADFGDNKEFDTPRLRIRYSSLLRPPTVFDVEPETRNLELVKQLEVPSYNANLYESQRIEITARDGTKIPVSLVYRKDLDRTRPQPLLLYGYGSYGIAMPADFRITRISYLDHGFIYAIAHIRGGGELGEKWRLGGKLRHKMNSFYDFIDVAEHFIKSNATTPTLMAARGGSAGGLLMGTVANLRPDLFKVMHLQVPFVDVLNTMFDATLPLTVFEYNEWGNPNLADDYRVMRQYCPYTNLKRQAYPVVLVTTSLHDSQVMYWEPAKYVAKLRICKSNATLTLFHINMEAGHSGASGRYDYLKEAARDDAIMLWQILGDSVVTGS